MKQQTIDNFDQCNTIILLSLASIYTLEVLKSIRECSWPLVDSVSIFNIPLTLELIPNQIKIKTIFSEAKRRLKLWHKKRKTKISWVEWHIKWKMLLQDVLFLHTNDQMRTVAILRLFDFPPGGVEECNFTIWKAELRHHRRPLNRIPYSQTYQSKNNHECVKLKE